MKLGSRVFFSYLLISVICLYYPFDWIRDTMRTRYMEGVEDPLVDHANTLAALVEEEMAAAGFNPETWQSAFSQLAKRQVDARIYRLVKEQVDTRVYITDALGKIIFDSREPSDLDKDYSGWRDVALTLKGQYGARATKEGSDEDRSTVLYVAAPIIHQGQIAGVLSVGKPTTNITWLVENARYQVVILALLSLLVAAVLSYLVSYWLTRPIRRLTDYALATSKGDHPLLPRLDNSEIGEMGQAFVMMQDALEGKKYVEQYIQHLTHEIKSPLSAIRGAAELLQEPMEEQQQRRFTGNILSESQRIQEIVDRMLELAALENRHKPAKMERIAIKALVNTLVESFTSQLAAKELQMRVTVCEATVMGDTFLLHRALANLVQNAVDFSANGGEITICSEVKGHQVELLVRDRGTGIAPYAMERVFEKFFSLNRPGGEKKSTGLGLNFVRQVATLHQGKISLENRRSGGVCATLSLPCQAEQ